MKHLAVLTLFLCAVGAAAQTSAPSGDTQGYDYGQTVQSATLRDHIAVDAGVWVPFGGLTDVGGIEPGFGFMIHFWKTVTENTFVIVSIGNSWMGMTGKVVSDSGEVIDLRPYTFNAAPVLGGVGRTFLIGDFRAFATINAGATILDLTTSKGLPAAFIEDNTFFTLGGSAGGGYNVAPWATILFTTRYLHMFGEEFSHLDVSLGASFQW